MSQYLDVFLQNSIQMEDLCELTDSDLEKMGISSLGHRKAIVSSIQNALGEQYISYYRRRTSRVITWYSLVAMLGAASVTYMVWKSSTGDQDAKIFVTVVCFGLVAFSYIYFLPSIIAWRKGHDYRWAILIVNALFGVTFIVQ